MTLYCYWLCTTFDGQAWMFKLTFKYNIQYKFNSIYKYIVKYFNILDKYLQYSI